MSEKKKTALRYLAGIAVLAPASCASVMGVTTFGGGVYIGCLLTGMPLYLFMPVYVALSLAVDFSVAHIVEVLVFAVVGALCAFPTFRKPYFYIPIYFLASLGCIYRNLFGDSVARSLLGMAMGAFALLVTVAAANEKSRAIGIGGLVFMVSVGFHASPYAAAVAAGAATLWLIRISHPEAIGYVALYGMGGVIATGNFTSMFGYVFAAAATAFFMRNRYTAFAAYAVAVTTYSFLLGASVYMGIAALGGAFVGMFLPVRRRISVPSVQVVLPVLRKMAVTAKACNELQMELGYQEPDEEELATAVAARTCEGCARCNECKIEGEAFFSTARRALKTRRAGIDVLNDRLIEQCIRASTIPKHLAVLLKDYEHTRALNDVRQAATSLAAEEMKSFAVLVESWIKEAKAEAETDAEIYHVAKSALAEKGATLETLRLYGGGVQVVARGAKDEDVLAALNRNAARPYVIDSVTELETAAEYMLLSKPRYALVYGVASAPKEKESGDLYLVKKLNASTILAVLSDGMGSGRNAKTLSVRTLGLIEAYFAAGFDMMTVLKFVNSLLSLGGDRFSCVDLCMIDLERGEAHFVKVGGQASVVLKEQERIVVDGGALPLGTSESVQPAVRTVALDSGDLIVLMTDGIADTETPVKDRVTNPQTLADAVLAGALEIDGGRPHDDMTVLVLRAV